MHESHDVSLDLFPFVSHCSLFSLGSEFTKLDLISLWIAEGLFLSLIDDSRKAEDVASDVFDSLVSHRVLVFSRFDKIPDFMNPGIGRLLYKVNDSSTLPPSFRPALLDNRYAMVSDNNFYRVPETILHLSILCNSVNQMNFEAMQKFVHLRSLFIFPSRGPSVEQVPRDLFLWLKHLRSLNLSGSHLSIIPSSIGNLKWLIYMDLSYTPIKFLPDAMVSLHNLQTLKLRYCSNLRALPKNMRKLTNLKHLDLDVLRALDSMPIGMGQLTNLQTLSAFLVGKNDGNRILELKHIVNLAGAFCISRLENVSSFEEAKEAALIEKKFLGKLELRWTNRRVRSNNFVDQEEEKILEHLQPPLGIQFLRIVCYCGSKLPSWISHPSYDSLTDLTLHSCSDCKFLPSIGELPSLQVLKIVEMIELKSIDHHFCRKDFNQQDHAFPKLQKLTIESMSKLEDWTGIQNGDFPELHTLKVERCPLLVSLPLLYYLYSLKHLELNHCPSILALPDSDLPLSLEFFLMKDCAELKKRCHKDEGKDWGKICHVPKIVIDYEKISWQVSMPEELSDPN